MNWKAVSTSPLVIVVAVALAYGAGRFSAPLKTVDLSHEKERVIERGTTVIEQKADLAEMQRILTQFAQQIQKSVARDVKTKKTTTTQPDGSKTVVEETEDKTKTDTKTDTQASSDTTKLREEHKAEVTKLALERDQAREKLRLIQKELQPPNWILGAAVTTPVTQFVPGLSLWLHHRLGPVSAGPTVFVPDLRDPLAGWPHLGGSAAWAW